MRKLFGVLFALLVILCVTDLVASIGDDGSSPSLLIIAISLLCGLSAITAFYLFRSQRMVGREMTCPACHEAGGLHDHSLIRPRPSLAALLFGGIIITLFIQHLPTQRFTCSVCSVDTYRRPYSSLLTLAWCVLLVFLIYVGCTIPETE